MAELKALPIAVLIHIAKLLKVPLKGMAAVIELLDGGATVPFIARYRKEVTGNLDEVQIRDIQEKLEYFRELEDRRETVLASIQEQGKLTPELKAKIEATLEKTELEDLYLPYKPKRRTKASMARDKGLEPLAHFLWEQNDPTPLAEVAAQFGMPAEEALEGARHIVAEMISENADFRKAVRAMMMAEGRVTSRAIEGVVDPEGKFKMYASYSEPASKIPSHRMLAIRRGAKEGVLTFEIELDPQQPQAWLRARVVRKPGDWVPHLERAVEDSYDRLLNPSIQTEVRLELKDRSDEEAIKVFRENLENLLLSPPAGRMSVLAIDPGIRTGCKLAVVDDTGKFLEDAVIYPFQPRNDLAGSVKTLASLIARHNVQAIAIGNGTASRESAAFVQDFLRQANLTKIFSVTVSESGASVYSASEMARQEFPDLDLTVRGAISIARRLQDPLAELVKVDPKSIGVGQYQHDVDQRRLKQSLEATVESCVNRVGVDLNTASWALLRYVAGITERTAVKIMEYRNEHGRFRSRVELMAVPGFGPKTFEQAAGFLRIRGGDNPLDMTAVHPESYRGGGEDGRIVGDHGGRADRQAGAGREGEAGGLRDRNGGHVHAGRHPRGVAQAGARSAREVRGGEVARRRAGDRRPQARHDARGRGHQRDALRRVRGRRRAPGRPGARERAGQPVRQGRERSGEGGTDRQGAGAEYRYQGEADRAFHEGAGRGAAGAEAQELPAPKPEVKKPSLDQQVAALTEQVPRKKKRERRARKGIRG